MIGPTAVPARRIGIEASTSLFPCAFTNLAPYTTLLCYPSSTHSLLFFSFEMLLLSLLWSSCFICLASASVTVYSQQPLGVGTATAAAANYTAHAAYDPTVLTAPPVPSPAPATTFFIQLNSAPSAVQGLSIPLSGAFMGFSVEFSVVNQVSEYQILTFFA
jgi:hypothetical protein